MAAGFTDFATGKVIAGLFKVLTGFSIDIMASIMGNGAGSGADSSPPAAETVSLPLSYNRPG